MAITAFDDVFGVYVGTLAATDQARVEGLIRRAERSLQALQGMPPLASIADQQLVKDTVVDAVIRRLDNPRGFIAESDGDYSYRLEAGSDGFMWPSDWQALFGVVSPAAPARTIPVRIGCGWGGWAR